MLNHRYLIVLVVVVGVFGAQPIGCPQCNIYLIEITVK